MTLTSPSMDNSSAELLPSGDSPLNKRMTENLLASLSEHERAAILSVPAAQNPEDLRMFARWGPNTKWMGTYPPRPQLSQLVTSGSRRLRWRLKPCGCPQYWVLLLLQEQQWVLILTGLSRDLSPPGTQPRAPTW